MRTVVVAKRKGGVGATTLCREVGVAAAQAGQRVCFVDLDPQASLWEWWTQRNPGWSDPCQPNPGFSRVLPHALREPLEALREVGADLVLVDTPPSQHRWLPGVLALADLVLLPTRPTTDDLRALGSVLDLVEEAERPFLLCPCQVPPGRSRLYDEALPLLARRGRVAPPLRLRALFPVAAGGGGAAVESAGSPAAAEVDELWRFVAGEMARLGRRKQKAGQGAAAR